MIRFVTYGSKSFIQREGDSRVFLGSISKDILSLIGKYYTFDRNSFVPTKEIKSEWSRESMSCILNCKNSRVKYNDTTTAQS